MNKKTIRLIIIVVMAVVVIVAGGWIYYRENLKPTGTADQIVTIDVAEGTTYQDLLNELEDKDLIKSAFVAKIYLKLHGADSIHVNTYELNKGMSLPEMINAVSTGDINYLVKVQMTVPEGLTIPDVASIVAETCGTSQKEVMATWSNEDYLNELINDYWFLDGDAILQEGIKYPLEGYLFPETYTITSQTPTIDEVTRAMLEMTSSQLDQFQEGMTALNFTPHEFLTFASIVERESLYDDDRPMIAEVFINRLQQEMNLESDITVLYALERTGVDLSLDEVENTDSPYNTYLYGGLPIGPISNVSEITMKSCVEHADHDYLFFYAGPDGEVYYAKTIDEHLANVENHPWPDE